MSDLPITPVTGAQVFAKYLAAILSGFPLGWFGGAWIVSALGGDNVPGVVPVGLTLLTIFAIGSYLGDRLEKMHSVSARWWLLFLVAVVPIGILVAILSIYT